MDLAQARDARRLRELGERCTSVDESARRLLARLFQCGAIFTRQGSRLGRDLLLSHQHLLRAAALVGRAGDCDEGAPEEADALYQEAAALVDRSAQIVTRCEASCARGQ
ncbi:MAG TPA: hypothetical protein VLT47_01285 [Anaeromyxobacteraceae bacterium]|nr:hypothetical protein [Anaeromyxobacteraceae bacterium]